MRRPRPRLPSRPPPPATSRLVLAAVLIVSPAPAQRVSDAVPRSLVQLAPPGSVLVVHARDPLSALERLACGRDLDHDRSLGGLLDREQAKRLALALGWLQLAGRSREGRVLGDLLRREVVAGVSIRGGSPSSFVLARGHDAGAVQETAQRLAALARASRLRAPAGVLAFALPHGGSVAVADELVVLSSDAALSAAIVDRYSRRAWEPPAGWHGGVACGFEARLDLAALRPLLPRDLERNAAKPAPLLFFAPWVEALRHGSEAIAAVSIEPAAVGLSVRVPGALAAMDDARRELVLSGDFAPDLVPAFAGEIARLSLSTSLGAYFRRRTELLDRSSLAEAEQGISIATLFFGGRKFDEDVLAHTSAGFHLVLAREPWEDHVRPPRVRYPAAALVLGVDDPTLAKGLHAAFHTAVLAGSEERARNGQAPFKVERDLFADVELSTARVRLRNQDGEPPADAGLSPSVAVVSGRAVVSTTESLARSLVTGIRSVPEPARARAEAGRATLARLSISGAGVIELLRDGRPALRLDAVLDTGKTPAQFDRELDLLLAALTHARSLGAKLSAADGGDLELDLRLDLRSEGRVR